MESLEYLRIIARRWWLIVAFVALGAVVGSVTTPSNTGVVTQPQASFAATVVLVPQPFTSPSGLVSGSGSVQAISIANVPFFVTSSPVLKAVARQLHFAGDPQSLATIPQVSLLGNVLSITVVDKDGVHAAQVANIFGAQLVAYLTNVNQQNQQQALSSEADTLTRLTNQISTLNTQLPSDPRTTIPPKLAVVKAQRDALLNLYSQDEAVYQQLLDAPPPISPLMVLQQATAVPAAESPALQPQTQTGTNRTTSSTTTTVAPVVKAPAHHSKTSRAGLGGLAGLLLGICLALGLARIDPHIRTPREAEQEFGAPVLAEIPRRRRAGRPKIIMTLHPSSVFADAYRRLRTRAFGTLPLAEAEGEWSRSLEQGRAAPTDEPTRGRGVVVLVTSPWLEEGKTEIVANLAAGLGQTSRSVVVVSADFRRPAIHEYFATSASPGLSDVLAAETWERVQSALQTTSTQGVRLLASGTPVAGELERLCLSHHVVSELRVAADAVLIDTPGFLVASDASELLADVDGVLLICRLGVTTRDRARRTVDALRRTNTPVLGVAVVGTKPPRRSRRWRARAVPTRRSHTRQAHAVVGETRNVQVEPAASNEPARR